ncbi:Protein-disulfide isomerase [Ruaniaceae bacterium KH17]|nr:Protein-disulfide isomerase [Ruaniaceae bacterium KH17]
MTTPPEGYEPATPTPSAGNYPAPGPSAQYPTYASAPAQPAPPQQPRRSVLVTVLSLLVMLLLGIVIGLLLSRTVLAPDDDASAPAEPTATATDPATDTEAGSTEAAPYPDAPSDDVLAVMEAQFRRTEGDSFAMGDVNAPVVIAEWADFRCSYCAKFHLETLPAIQHFIDEGVVRYEWNDFPVLGEESVDLAVAGRAAGDQGLFFEMSHAIVNYQFVEGGTDLSNENLIAIAEEIGMPDIATFTESLENSQAARAAIQASYDNATQIFGKAATPQFVVNAQYIGGWLDGEGFTTVIEQELQRVADNG